MKTLDLDLVEIQRCLLPTAYGSTRGGYVFTGVCLLNGGGAGTQIIHVARVISQGLASGEGVLRPTGMGGYSGPQPGRGYYSVPGGRGYSVPGGGGVLSPSRGRGVLSPSQGKGVHSPNRGVFRLSTPPPGTYYAAVGIPLVFTQEDLCLLLILRLSDKILTRYLDTW